MSPLQHYLGKLAEEGAEVAQIALKTQQFGAGEVMPGQPLNNFERCHQELDDLLAIVEELNEKFSFGYAPSRARIDAKKSKVLTYLGLSIRLSMVDGETDARDHELLSALKKLVGYHDGKVGDWHLENYALPEARAAIAKAAWRAP